MLFDDGIWWWNLNRINVNYLWILLYITSFWYCWLKKEVYLLFNCPSSKVLLQNQSSSFRKRSAVWFGDFLPIYLLSLFLCYFYAEEKDWTWRMFVHSESYFSYFPYPSLGLHYDSKRYLLLLDKIIRKKHVLRFLW